MSREGRYGLSSIGPAIVEMEEDVRINMKSPILSRSIKLTVNECVGVC